MQSSTRDRQSGAIEARRIPTQRPVELRYPMRQGYVIRSTVNISMTGMYIQTDDPLPVGSAFSFRCRLENDRPVEGTAEVRWTRDSAGDESQPVGMAVRFLELDDTSTRAVRWFVEKSLHADRLHHTQIPDKDPSPAKQEVPAPVADEAVDAPRPPTGAQASPWGPSADWREEIRQRRKRRRSARLLAALLLLLLAATVWLTLPRLLPLLRSSDPGPISIAEDPSTPPVVAAPPETASVTTDAPTDTAATEQRDVPPPAQVASPSPAELPSAAVPTPYYEAEIESFLNDWVTAWSDQRADAYLDYYAASFVPDGMDRGTWEEQRRTRITRPRFIQIRLTGLSILPTAGDAVSLPSARATFVQSYRSDTFRDTVLKTLDLAREGDGWRILREASEVIEL